MRETLSNCHCEQAREEFCQDFGSSLHSGRSTRNPPTSVVFKNLAKVFMFVAALLELCLFRFHRLKLKAETKNRPVQGHIEKKAVLVVIDVQIAVATN